MCFLLLRGRVPCTEAAYGIQGTTNAEAAMWPCLLVLYALEVLIISAALWRWRLVGAWQAANILIWNVWVIAICALFNMHLLQDAFISFYAADF